MAINAISFLVSCSTQLTMKFQMPTRTKALKKAFLAFKLSDAVFIMPIKTIVGILIFMSMIKI